MAAGVRLMKTRSTIPYGMVTSRVRLAHLPLQPQQHQKRKQSFQLAFARKGLGFSHLQALSKTFNGLYNVLYRN